MIVIFVFFDSLVIFRIRFSIYSYLVNSINAY